MDDLAQVSERVNDMWKALAERFVSKVGSVDILNDPRSAIHMALCAEACFWKGSGESDTHDIKDVLPIIAPERDADATD